MFLLTFLVYTYKYTVPYKLLLIFKKDTTWIRHFSRVYIIALHLWHCLGIFWIIMMKREYYLLIRPMWITTLIMPAWILCNLIIRSLFYTIIALYTTINNNLVCREFITKLIIRYKISLYKKNALPQRKNK